MSSEELSELVSDDDDDDDEDDDSVDLPRPGAFRIKPFTSTPPTAARP